MIHYISTDGLGSPWIALELSVLERDGVPFELHAMRKPAKTPDGGAWIAELHDRTRPIYPLGPAFVVSVVRAFLFAPGRFVAALGNAIFGRRENLRARVSGLAHFFVGCHWAMALRARDARHIHSQWAHSCASIGMYAAWLLDVGFSFTGHGADLWRDRVALEDKIRRARFIVCISDFHRRYYLEHGADESQLFHVYCGIDRSRFVAKRCEPALGAPALRIRSHSRVVEKKGFPDLIEACRFAACRVRSCSNLCR